LVAAAAAGCGADFWAFKSQQTGPNPHTVLVIAWFSDSPVDDAENVWVTLDRVELVGASGTETLSSRRTTYDLLALRNGVRAEIGRAEIPAEDYHTLRLVLAPDSGGTHRIRVDGAIHDLTFDVAGSRVVEIPVAASFQEDGTTELHVDMDARTSVVQAGAWWRLDPAASCVDLRLAGAMEGRVLGAASLPLAGAIVSAQRASVEVSSTRTAADGTWSLGPLAPGLFTIVVTAPGHQVRSLGPILVSQGATLPGVDAALEAAVDGSVLGSAPTGKTAYRVRVFLGANLVAIAGVDPVTGGFLLPRLAPATYRMELWDGPALVDVLPAVPIAPGGSVTVGFDF
jgi:hypothetical protein